ncbi:hypothetical protein COX58_00675 [archaeon CG_4_10_14_0_2_um_filter_Archaea_38_6]|nr:MAG: hypothetical protein COS83_02515 [archaeon CG07_land_8_20_14_0_80_38_8]PIU88468.1 MAG: hypothetical protein COS64_03900 [archaeon CG06_land_8_20_14_3_00_37_11]PJA22992.1 MAG: hypothetical protein COX58_00675 [archaeon CG_4_10_14_0_2_um_filter_Archaea_38_6]
MDWKKLFFILFLLILPLRWLLNDYFLTAYTVFIFIIPFVQFLKNKDYHLFFFDKEDTLQSVGINVGYALVFIVVLFLVGVFTGNFGWAIIYGLSWDFFMKILLISFFQEMLFRYFIQGNLVNYFGKIAGIAAASLISAVLFYPDIWMSIIFLLMGLVVGWVFSNTKDIYGATISHFMIYLFAVIMV